MSKDNGKSPFMYLLAGISLITAIITLYQFVYSGNLVQFWSFQWTMSIVFIFGFFWAGVGLLKLGQSPEKADLAMVVFGIGYLVASLIVYVFFDFQQVSRGLSFGNYMGFVTILGVSVFFGTLSIITAGKKFLRYPSYGYGLSSLLLAISLVNKYVFSGHPFEWSNFIGEIALLIIGSSIFLLLYEYPFVNK